MPANNPKENTGSVGRGEREASDSQDQNSGQSRGGYGNTSSQQGAEQQYEGSEARQRGTKSGDDR